MINFIIVAVIVAIMFFAIRKIVRDRKNGGCGCGCSGCSENSKCHHNK